MKKFYKRIGVIFIISLVLILVCTFTVFCENDTDNNLSADTGVEAEINIEDSDEALEIADKLDTLLDPNNNELQEEIDRTLDKYADNPIVEFFKKLIEAIARFIEKVLALATDAAKIEVE
ncbi:MAG: hypothetical protein J5590_08970 [Clostridia bacterium]|nr:hypothetical protein [Clostridia bacterium]